MPTWWWMRKWKSMLWLPLHRSLFWRMWPRSPMQSKESRGSMLLPKCTYLCNFISNGWYIEDMYIYWNHWCLNTFETYSCRDLLETLLLPVVLIETVDLTEIVALINDATPMLSEPRVIKDSSKTSFQLCIKLENFHKYKKFSVINVFTSLRPTEICNSQSLSRITYKDY